VSAHRRSIEERLIDQSHPSGSAEGIAATHLRSVASRRPPGPVALARVRARLESSTAEPIPSRLRWKTIAALVALSAGIGGVTGAAVSVVIPILRRPRQAPVGTVSAPIESRVRGRQRRQRQTLDESETVASPTTSAEGPAANLFAAEPMPAPAPVSGVASGTPSPWIERARVSKKLALVEPPPAPAVPISAGTQPAAAIAQEARLLGRALQSLHRDHDPRAALVALDDHAARFSGSPLGPEADIIRVDALLALDRRQSALAVLDRLEMPDTTRGRELVVVRAELRVGAKRYAEAITDFTRALANADGDALSERALHGRIACYLATGNEALARADLENYLIRFREGRFAPGVRRSLGEIDRRP
jgi:hypothetical protein